MKKIGIDGSALVRHHPTGVEVATRELIQALLKIDTTNQYVIYTPQPLSQFGSATNVSNRVVPVSRWWSQRALPQAANQDRLDIFWSPSNILPVNVKAKTIATVHDLAFMRFPGCYSFKSWILSWITARRSATANAVIAVSQQTKQDLMKFFRVAADKIKVVYNALPAIRRQTGLDEIRQKYQLPDRFLLVVGRVEPRKNPRNILLAFSRIHKQHPDIKLVFVGAETSYITSVKQLVSRLGLQEQVVFLGFAPIEDVFTLYQAATMLLFPSLYEGFGIPILEAWAARTPVLTSSGGATQEIAGDAAILADPQNPQDIAHKALAVLDNSELSERYIRAGLDRLKNFSWDHSARKLKDIIESL